MNSNDKLLNLIESYKHLVLEDDYRNLIGLCRHLEFELAFEMFCEKLVSKSLILDMSEKKKFNEVMTSLDLSITYNGAFELLFG